MISAMSSASMTCEIRNEMDLLLFRLMLSVDAKDISRNSTIN